MPTGSAAVELAFTLDPAASQVAIEGFIVPVEGDMSPQGTGSDVTEYSGSILLDVDDPFAPTSIEFLGGSATGGISGDWLPQVGGGDRGGFLPGDADPGTAQPANYGLEAQALGVGHLWLAFRDLALSPMSTSIPVADGVFAVDQMLTLEAGSADYTVASILFGDRNDHIDLVGKVAENLAESAGSYRVEGGLATLQFPVELFVEVEDEETGFPLLELTFTGSVTATAILESQPPLLGDYNANGRVEQADLDLVLLNWGMTLAQPWVDGTVDQAELDSVLLNWGNEAALGSAVGVPEPAAATLLLAALAFARSKLITRRNH